MSQILNHRNTAIIPTAPNPSRAEKLKMWALVSLGCFFLLRFLIWFFSDKNNVGNPLFYWLLTGVLLFKIFRWLHEWVHYCFLSTPKTPELKSTPTVDVFTTYCAGEPLDMVKSTLLAMVNMDYPHKDYLCDESDNAELKEFCGIHGIHHMTRLVKKNAKAGNINNALNQSNGEICVVLDPDHVPVPQFLARVLPYFEDQAIGFVQCVQGYGNQEDSFVAAAAAEQTYHFYGPLMMGMNGLGTVQAIGANCTFRRTALESIGGHAAGLSEDMHTAMKLHAKGWKSVYIPEMLSIGQVPSSLSAFLKQQLKWSRGTFELLFTTYPRLFCRFTISQKLHYFFLPLYYLYGFITLVDILIPSLSLILSDSPWQVDLGGFYLVFLPMFGSAILIRMYAQNWLVQKKERGFHFLGGLLRMGTWWVYCLGFFCTILRIKIPYIPTSKDNYAQNEWMLVMPNLILAGFGMASIWYGLRKDFSPYSLIMAGFAGFGSLLLIILVIMVQQKTINAIFSMAFVKKHFHNLVNRLLMIIEKTCGLLRNRAFIAGLLIAVSSILFAMLPLDKSNHQKKEISGLEKEIGGFYTGIYIPSTERLNSLKLQDSISMALDRKFDIVSIYQYWGPESLERFPSALLNTIYQAKGMPMITWEPYSNNFPEFKNDASLAANWRIFDAIIHHKFDKYIMQYADSIKHLNRPVMIRFAHEMDNPSYPWSLYGGGNTPEEFIEGYRHVVTLFNTMGATNVTWVWNPWEEDKLAKYYPGDDFVDWIGVTNLNYGLANSNGKWAGFEDLYNGFHDRIMAYNKPVMLSEFGSTDFGGEKSGWFRDAFEKIKSKYHEIKAVVFFSSNEDKNWGNTRWRPKNGADYIDWTFLTDSNSIAEIKKQLATTPFNQSPPDISQMATASARMPIRHSDAITGNYPNFKLMVDKMPFYVKGVAYNVNQDWRDSRDPLTRKLLEADFKQIKQMGANTIRKYASDIYDDNVLNIASENGLKVLFGFWFENNIDYLTDEKACKDYEEKVLNTVKKYKNHPGVLGWSLGNEVWGLLKHHFGQPYLTVVRSAYAAFIEQLTVKIHEIDNRHPVITVAESTNQLVGEIYMYHKLTPSLDVIGVNSYYEHHISNLANFQYLSDTSRPVIVTEFGPNGYWDSFYSVYNPGGRLVEMSGMETGQLYAQRWKKYIEGKQGINIGGIAYTWQDRREGTATWFGLTDAKKRLKPAYNSLKSVWTNTAFSFPIQDIYIYSPPNKISKGKKSTFYAITENLKTNDLVYEWELRQDDILETSIDMMVEDQGKRVSFIIPEDRKGLRLFLYVSKLDGNFVNTASFPIL